MFLFPLPRLALSQLRRCSPRVARLVECKVEARYYISSAVKAAPRANLIVSHTIRYVCTVCWTKRTHVGDAPNGLDRGKLDDRSTRQQTEPVAWLRWHSVLAKKQEAATPLGCPSLLHLLLLLSGFSSGKKNGQLANSPPSPLLLPRSRFLPHLLSRHSLRLLQLRRCTSLSSCSLRFRFRFRFSPPEVVLRLTRFIFGLSVLGD